MPPASRVKSHSVTRYEELECCCCHLETRNYRKSWPTLQSVLSCSPEARPETGGGMGDGVIQLL